MVGWEFWNVGESDAGPLEVFIVPRGGFRPSRRAEVILHRWKEVVRQKLPNADELTLNQLRDDLPNVLEKIAHALESVDRNSLSELRQASEAHGEARFHQSYNVNEVLIEYGLLRPIMLDEVMSHVGRDITHEEIAAVNMGIDAAVRRSVTQFVAEQQKQLKLVTDAQTKYLSFLSHDLRGGLNGVLLMVEVLKRELAGEEKFAESMQDLDTMRRSILDTVGTMDRFLHAERFRQGKVQVQNSTVDVQALVKDLSHHFAYQVKEKGIGLKVEVIDGAKVFSDRELLMLILQNLISNAVKYTSSGKVNVRVEPVNAGKSVRISVIDEGPGIAQNKLATLFEPFMRGETHGQAGVGLGLSIAKQAADLMKAKLTAESTLGQGSTFRLELPSQ